MWPHRRDELGTEGDILDKVAVHHVEVEPVRPGLLGPAHFLAHLRPVGREEGGGDDSGLAVAHVGAIIFTLSGFRNPGSRIPFDMVFPTPDDGAEPIPAEAQIEEHVE